jgi:hypothetical protein
VAYQRRSGNRSKLDAVKLDARAIEILVAFRASRAAIAEACRQACAMYAMMELAPGC